MKYRKPWWAPKSKQQIERENVAWQSASNQFLDILKDKNYTSDWNKNRKQHDENQTTD